MLRALHSGQCKEDQAVHGNGFSFHFLSFPCPCSRKDFASHVICIFIEKAYFTFMRAKNVQEGEASKKLVKRFFLSLPGAKCSREGSQVCPSVPGSDLQQLCPVPRKPGLLHCAATRCCHLLVQQEQSRDQQSFISAHSRSRSEHSCSELRNQNMRSVVSLSF